MREKKSSAGGYLSKEFCGFLNDRDRSSDGFILEKS